MATTPFPIFQNVTLSSPTLLLILLFTTIILAWVRKRSTSKSKNVGLPPGPRGLPIIGNLAYLHPELHSYFASLAQTHGPIFKLQLGRKLGIVITSPSLAKQVLKDNDVTFANRDVPEVARVAAYGGSDIVWTPYGPQWRLLRKVCVLKMLSNTILDSVYDLRKREVRKTVSFLKSRGRAPVNVGEQIFLTILNVITNMLWGGTIQEEEKERLGREFKDVVGEITELLGLPNLADFFPVLGSLDPQRLKRKMKVQAMKFDEIFERMIDKRRRMMEADDQGGEKDFLEFLLNLEEEEYDVKTKLSMLHVKALLMDMIVGGSDTSSNSIEFAMAEVINSPRVLRKAQDELDAVIGKHKIVEESHITKLPYLYSIMKESLRLHPALPLLVPHSPSETCTVGGYTIPKGARVFVNVWAIHRDPSIWENPLEFKPERFLDGKWDYSGNDFSYFPFGSGRRICAGIAMAERMFMYSLATLLHSFDWKVPEGKKVDLTEKFGIVLKLKTPLEAIPVPRFPNPSLYE